MTKKQDIKKFALPPAKILRFNLKGKSVLDTSIADRVYLTQRGYTWLSDASDDEVAESAWAFKIMDWKTRNVGKSANAAIADGTLPPNPKWHRPETGRTDPPAA
jgi:hypothetical protein